MIKKLSLSNLAIIAFSVLNSGGLFAAAYDYDGDGKADIAVRRAATHYQYIKNSEDSDIQRVVFGKNELDIPVSGDFDGDNIADVAVRRPSNFHWYIKNSSNGVIQRIQFGKHEDDIPVPADYDGDGITDVAVRRASNQYWYIKNSSDGVIQRINFGKQEDDIPVPADYDGDGKADVAVRRASNFTWYIKNSSNGQIQRITFGKHADDIPIPADYDGDGKADVAVRRASNQYFYIRNSSDGAVQRVNFGKQAKDIPVIADYDGDGKADLAVRRASNQHFYIKQSSNGAIQRLNFGLQETDIPLAAPVATVMAMVSPPPEGPELEVTSELLSYDNTLVLLEATSSDEDSANAITYEWQQISGTEVEIVNANSATAQISIPELSANETLLFKVTATNAQNGQSSAQVSVQVQNSEDSVGVSIDSTAEVNEGESILLRASDTDPNNVFVSASWRVLGFPNLVLQNGDTLSPTFQAPGVETDTDFHVVVTLADGNGYSVSDTIVITVLNSVDSDPGEDGAPVIEVTETQQVYGNSLLILDAVATDPDGTDITYLWEQTSGTTVTIDSPESSRVQIHVPDLTDSDTMTFTITATDQHNQQSSRSVEVTVKPRSNDMSVDAGDDVTVAENESVNLQADISDENNIFATAKWWALDDSGLSFESPDSTSTAATAPPVSDDILIEVLFTVTDSEGYAFTDKLTMYVTNLIDNDAPNVAAPEDITLREGESGELTASSVDPNNLLNTIFWEQVSGVNIELSDTDQFTVRFSAPEVTQDEIIVLRITVTDVHGQQASDDVSIIVLDSSRSVAFNMTCTTPPAITNAHPVNNMRYEHFMSTAYLTDGVYNKVLLKADLNSDNLDDLVMGGENTSGLEKDEFLVLLSDGDGTFTQATDSYLSSAPAAATPVAAAADFNGDGKPDIVVFDAGNTEQGQASGGGFQGEAPTVMLSQEDGTFVVSQQLAEHYQAVNDSETMHAKSVTVGDIDLDGDMDIFVESGGGTNIISHFLINDGNGVFTQDYDNRLRTIILNGGEDNNTQWRYAYHSLKDMNQDGAPDLVMGRLKRINNGQDLNANKIAYNDGNGYFQLRNVVELPGVDWNDDYTYVKSIITEDINGDGAIDVLMSHERGNNNANSIEGNTGRYIQALISDCAGGFIDETEFFLGDQTATTQITGDYGANVNAPHPMIFEDANDDGLQDLIMAGSSPVGDDAPYIYIRKDNRSFESQWSSLFTFDRWFGEDAYPIDLNGDGVLDLIHSDLTPGADLVYGTGDEVSQIISTIVTKE